MNIVFNFTRLAVAILVAVLGVAGCASVGATPGGRESVVASTTVWAGVARQVAGDRVGVTVDVHALIRNAAADPHSYEASTRDELAIRRAGVIVENGGGYDDFVGTLRAAGGAKGTLLDAVRIAGVHAGDGDLNEHVWYDFPAVARIADRLAGTLAAKDPADAATFRANARVFTVRLRALERREAAIRTRFGGTPVAITEPVPLYLLTACGLVNRTPEEFSSAVEDGQDVAVRVLHRTERLFSGHQVRVLVENAQTSGAQVGTVIGAARAAGVPVVPVTETLPAGRDYLQWMTDNVGALESALEGGAAR